MIQFTSPVAKPCTFKVADMNRAIAITSASQFNGEVTAQTAAPHGLLAGAVVYLENSGGWNGWQTVVSVPNPAEFVFSSSASGAPGGNAGVLVDDANPALFTSANQDSRAGNLPSQFAGTTRTLVIGKRRAEVGLDGNRYSRALQAYSRHHLSLTCGTQNFDQDFRTANIPTGNTHNDGPPVDPATPGQYAYPTVQWNNLAQSLIDPLSGLRSQRAAAPVDAASDTMNFVTSIDAQASWTNSAAPLSNNGAAASFAGPCRAGICALFLRADNLSIPGGATYNYGVSSLDWVTVTVNQASIQGACSGDDCKIQACLTVNGVSCTGGVKEASLSAAPAAVTFGSGALMDFWQTAGAPPINGIDASTASGTVNYNAATRQVSLVNGNGFNVKWTAGSNITIAGAQHPIASIQNERLLTLASGPGGNLSSAAYSANNFGVLIWKKTASTNRVSLGYTTYQTGSAPMPLWSAAAVNNCSPAVSVGGVAGNNCFLGNELYWISSDGTDVRDLGQVGFWFYGAGEWSQYATCGSSGVANQFDPQNGDVWYCMATPYFDYSRISIVQARYMGSHARYTPGKQIPDCAINGGAQPCIAFTLMQPEKSDSLPFTAPNFNPDLKAIGYSPGYYLWGGISNDGDMLIYTNTLGQDSLGWMFVYTLGDRTPTGTTANSFRIVGSASTFRKAPLSWCTIHFVTPPDGGWVGVYSNDYTYDGPLGTYTMTMTSPQLNATPGAPGGLSLCPPNPLGVTGAVCTAITVTGEPVSQLNGTMLQNLQVGDVMQIPGEYLRVVSIASPTQFTVQRGYTSSIGSPSGSVLTMACGTVNMHGAHLGLWNYRNDPYGANSTLSTILPDPTMVNGHNYIGTGVFVTAASVSDLGDSMCPMAYGGLCYQVRQGNMITAAQGPQKAVMNNPPFAKKVGNSDESHPGPCFGSICTDGRPLLGGSYITLGSAASPFQPLTGQIWKISNAQTVLNRKQVATMAYVGRWPLADVSGPGSVLGSTAKDSYKYCYAAAAGECMTGSAAGDVYLNAPYVNYPYCYNPGWATQDDDTLSICIGDLGAYTGELAQFTTANADLVGAATRSLGPNYSKWNQFDAYWNAFMTPSGGALGSQVRWMDGVRTDNLLTVLPPFPTADGAVRSSFLSVPVTLPAPTTAGVQSAIVEFGYAENGSSTSYYCTSRQETCVATANAINSDAPFAFEQSEAFTAAPCAHGCTIAIPALSQRALYYRWKFLGSSGQVLQTGTSNVAITQ